MAKETKKNEVVVDNGAVTEVKVKNSSEYYYQLPALLFAEWVSSNKWYQRENLWHLDYGGAISDGISTLDLFRIYNSTILES